ncbi:hypothetical protein QZH41_014830 [Actinostola sp. cb2023]|nr:hypothetical protein QZH41_014830 [Actinostola sp. cb2023]
MQGSPPFREIDFLGVISSPIPPGVHIIPGPYGDGGAPAFRLDPWANVGRFAGFFFSRKIKASFSIITTIRPKNQRGGYIFSLMQFPMHSSVLLGLKVFSDSIHTYVTLEYTDAMRKRHVFRFKVPQFTGSWRRLGVAMARRSVTLYVDCQKVGAKTLNKDAPDIDIPSASGVYVGRAGWKVGETPFLIGNVIRDHCYAPLYLSSLLESYIPKRALRSASKGLLRVPRSATSTYGDRTYSIAAPKLWNNLPETIRNAGTINQFKSMVKTHLFKDAFN